MTATIGIDLDSSADVLRVARESRAVAVRADAVLMVAAVTWAEQHPPESIDEAERWGRPSPWTCHLDGRRR